MVHGDVYAACARQPQVLDNFLQGVDLIHWDGSQLNSTSIDREFQTWRRFERAAPRFIALHNINVPGHSAAWINGRLQVLGWKVFAKGMHTACPNPDRAFLHVPNPDTEHCAIMDAYLSKGLGYDIIPY